MSSVSMTIDEFFERLPRDGWVGITADNVSVRDRNKYCAIWVVYAEDFLDDDCEWPIDVFAAGEEMGLAEETALQIVRAADNSPGHDPALRARLLEHCQLTEPQ